MIFRFALLGLTLLSLAHAMPLQDGEHLAYRVSWAVVPGAGEIKIDAGLAPDTPGRLLVTTTTTTRRFARMLLPFDASAVSTYDLATGRLMHLHEKSKQRSKAADHTVAFDYTKREALYRRTVPAEPARTLPFPEGEPADLIMALLQTRTWSLAVGEKRDALVLFDDDFYELTIHAVRRESVRTPVGTFDALVLEPRMEKTAPKGMFKRGGTVRVWIAQDEHRLPVRFEVEFKIGTGTATLESYRPPTSAPAASGAPVAKGAGGAGAPAAAIMPTLTPADAKAPRP